MSIFKEGPLTVSKFIPPYSSSSFTINYTLRNLLSRSTDASKFNDEDDEEDGNYEMCLINADLFQLIEYNSYNNVALVDKRPTIRKRRYKSRTKIGHGYFPKQ